MVVKAEKHGYVRYKALNAIMAVFPLNIYILSVVLFNFNSFSVLVPFLFHGVTWSATLSDRPFPLSSAIPDRGGILPMVV